MPKRSRYEYVNVVNNNIQLYSAGTTHSLTNIISWDAYEIHSQLNPEDVQYNIYFVGSGYNMVLSCLDETEYNSISNELTELGIGKRI